MSSTSKPTAARPLSPHLQIWKFHPTMVSSILHRASGVMNAIGAILITLWLLMVASGPQAYAIWEGLREGPLGILVTLALIGFTLSLVYHLFNGLRHLAWDAGAGYDPKGSNLRSMIIFAASILVTAGLWVFAGGLI
jgi:succinate dehydrogenase / fumarate reductase cytochrome b subunit